jgi:hypothetical protein
MAKRPDHGNDSTQELTMDQLVPPPRKPPVPESTMPLSKDQIVAAPKPPPQKVSKNDASVWRGLVVGADDFAPMPTKNSRVPRWVVFGLLGAIAAVVVAVIALTWSSDDKAATPTASLGSAKVETPPVKPEPTKPLKTEGVAAVAVDAGVETKPPVVVKPEDTVDAISGAAPPTTIKKKAAATTKAPALTKKAPVTKKPAPKRR